MYVDLSSCTSYGAALDVKINNIAVLRAQTLFASTAQGQTRSNAAVLLLHNNDVLKVVLPSGFCVYGGTPSLTSFQGFLLAPT